MKSGFIFYVLILIASTTSAQTKRVLFIGNSYTYENNLPQLVANLASSAGDTVIFDSNTIGGATFYSHSIDAVTISKIMSGYWDYVVLQGQSLELFGYFSDVLGTFPEVKELDSMINLYNPCAETMFFRTWGRENGLAPYSFDLMDSLIHVNYMQLADTLEAVVSPVGEVWKYIRQNYPVIELYQSDESHPSLAGSYAAACSFYSAIFREDPTLCTFNSALTAIDADNIKNAAKVIVFDSLAKWHVGEYDSLFVNCTSSGIPSIEYDTRNIYPNPASDFITIEFAGAAGEPVFLYDAAGFFLNRMILSAKKQIDVSFLPSGLYFVRALSENKSRKLIKF